MCIEKTALGHSFEYLFVALATRLDGQRRGQSVPVEQEKNVCSLLTGPRGSLVNMLFIAFCLYGFGILSSRGRMGYCRHGATSDK